MNFKESLDYLYGLGYELSVKKFGLENTIKLLKALDNPEKKYLKVQIGGTNGKGSTCAFLEAICVEAGIKVGKFTSPHLISVTERVCIVGQEISEADFGKFASIVREASEKLVQEGELEALPTFFEQVTAISLLAFADSDIELAILEVGLGGRFDATTATNAEIVAITQIDLDHTNILGDTIEEIASEKAAIIRKDTQVVLSVQSEKAEKIILDQCNKFGVSPKLAEEVFTELKFRISSFKTNKSEYKNIQLSLPGKHQIENAKVAILLAESLIENGFQISTQNIIEGLQRAKHKGRLEYYENILFDGAHNVAGAKVLREYLNDTIKQPITMIFGTMSGKDLNEMSKILFPLAEHLIVTTPENPRAMKANEISEFVPKEFDENKIFVIDEIPKAIEKAREIAGENLILVTGSLYLIGEVQKYLQKSEYSI